MEIKNKFWKILIAALLYSLMTHWKDAKHGFLDGLNDEHEISVQKNSINSFSVYDLLNTMLLLST